MFAHLVSRFFKKWFGFSPAVFDSGIVERAFKMVLLPVWKVDLVMRGKALLQDTELDLNSESRAIIQDPLLSFADALTLGLILEHSGKFRLSTPLSRDSACPRSMNFR